MAQITAGRPDLVGLLYDRMASSGDVPIESGTELTLPAILPLPLLGNKKFTNLPAVHLQNLQPATTLFPLKS